MTATAKRWERRDELAARFMEAIVGSTIGADEGVSGQAEALATAAYVLADAFLAVRGEQAALGGLGPAQRPARER